MSRKITFANKELRLLMEKRNQLVKEGRKEDEQRQKLEESLKKKGLELQKIDGKARKIVDKQKLELKREDNVWEEIVSIGLEDQKVAVQIEDKVSEYIAALKKRIKESKK